MTPEERELFTKQIAIQEQGNTRQDAVMAAFELCFPGDYRECMQVAAHFPDGENDLYWFLEKKISPQTREKGPPLNAISQKLDLPNKAPETPPKAAMVQREGLAALEYMTSKGIALIGVYESGATIASGEEWASAFTTDMSIINALRSGTDSRVRGRISRFYFLPEKAGLLCLDIDRKNGKDGIEEFYTWAEKAAGKPRHLLPCFLQNIPQNFPCYVSTPSGGLHIYFKYCGEKLKKKPIAHNAPAVEIKHGSPGLTSPGSYKNGKPYILYGDIEAAPQLPAFILAAIESPKQKAAAYKPLPQEKKEWGRPSWDKIREWTEKDGSGAGRNDKAFHLARHARNHGYTEAETMAAIREELSLADLPEREMRTAVRSAFGKGTTV